MPDAPPPIPDFALLRPIGRGAYGEVWLGRSVTGVYRAVKIVRRDSFSEDRPFDREFAGIQRFEPVSMGQESQVGLLHVGRNEAEGFFYYVMELADDVETGEEIYPERYVPKTLKELRTRRKRLAATDCLDIGLALTRALAHLHDNGLVHRDIKPSNVIFVHGIPKLADIGLVSNIDTSQSFVGTEGFVPPEGPGKAPADIFSLGKVLYEISTGCDRTDFPNLPEDLDDVPDRRALLELNEVVLKACDSDLERRYATAAEMRDDLLLVQAGRSVRRLHLIERRLRFIMKYGVAATIIAALAIAAFLWASRQTRKANENFERAERAEAEAVSRLDEANLNFTRANRLTGRAGFRFNSLPELARMARRTNRVDYRNEAIASFALPDARPAKQWAKTPYWDTFRFSHDFRTYGTNDASGSIHIRDTATDEMRFTLPSQGAPLTHSVSSRDGRMVATSDVFGRAWLWTLGGNAPARLPFGSDSKLVTFTADNAFLVVRPAEDMVEFINVTNRQIEQTIAGLLGARSAQLNDRSDRLLLVESNRAHIHRRSDGLRLRTITYPENVSATAWHPDGLRIAVIAGRTVFMNEATSGKQLAMGVGHEASVVGSVFDPSGDWLVTSSWDRTTRFWRADTLREVTRLNVSGNGLCVSADGRHLAFRSWDHTKAQLFELAETDVVQRYQLPGQLYSGGLSFHPDGQWLVAVSKYAPFIFNPPHPAPVGQLIVSGTYNVAFSPDGSHMLTAGGRGMRRWPVGRSLDGTILSLGPREVIPQTHHIQIEAFYTSADGAWCVTAKKDIPGLFGFSLNQTNAVVPMDAKVASTHLFDVNRDGTFALGWAERHPNRIQLWNPQTGQLVAAITNASRVRAAAFSPDGRWLASACLDSTTLWTLEPLQLRHRIPHPPTQENRHPVVFSPDSRTLAVVASDSEIWLVDVASATMFAALPVDRIVSAMTFNRAGNVLAVIGEASWFDLWDLHLLRKRLADLNLDWSAPPLPPPVAPSSWTRLDIIE